MTGVVTFRPAYNSTPILLSQIVRVDAGYDGELAVTWLHPIEGTGRPEPFECITYISERETPHFLLAMQLQATIR